MMLLLAASIFLRLAAGAGQDRTQSTQCKCGYKDPNTKALYTEAIIMYFNETAVDQNVFSIQDYQNKNQKGWNTIFKQGASPSNVMIGNNGSLPWQDYIDGTSPSLEMWLDGFEFNHFSQGAELRSLRRDILYGTFRASMRSAQPWVGGSAMSMYLQYNSSQQIHIDLLNMNAADQARVMQTIDGEWPDDKIAVNYTRIQKGDPPKIPPLQPFDFIDVGFDWHNKSIDFWIGKNNTRHVTMLDRDLTAAPESLYLSHWSTGDSHYMQGPPANRSLANVRWIRAFFNSSLMTEADHKKYDQRCNFVEACSVDDTTLRGSSAYSPAAKIPWKEPVPNQRIRDVAGYIAAAFSVFGIISIINAIIRRGPWYKLKNIYIPGSKRASTQALRRSLRQSIGVDQSNHYPGPPSGNDTPTPGYTSRPGGISPQFNDLRSGRSTPLPAYEAGVHSPWLSMQFLIQSRRNFGLTSGRTTPSHTRNLSSVEPPRALTPPTEHPSPMTTPVYEEDETEIKEARKRAYLDLGGHREERDSYTTGLPNIEQSSSITGGSRKAGEKKQLRFSDAEIHRVEDMRDLSFKQLENKGTAADEKSVKYKVATAPQDMSFANDLVKDQTVPDAMTGAATAEPTKEQTPQAPNQPQQRIDYLAGLVAISCIMVTLRHFSLTFWPYVTEAQGEVMHFQADKWLSPILGPYVLTPLWIGPFFVTSCRFLAQRYLKTGKIEDIANKMLLRAPRMLIPCFIFITLEYFFISLGLTQRLEWLPSVTYSTWPYVIPQPNFGVFLNEMVELSYLIPNAAPEIINHYCVGVLWTIPVQLQFSFVVLLATVLIKDIKTPWKRMLVYTLSIFAGWYGSSWSACHWIGLLLADLDITYNWVKWTQARWWALYPILTFAFLITAATPLVLLFNSSIFYFSFMSWEGGIHPDSITGRPLFETLPSIYYAYPDYFAPNLAILTFSVGLQVIVELSTWMQKALSIKLITFFHPHIMTIYLSHGFIFWSLGSFTAVALSSAKLPYWAILLITALVCYTVIFLVTILITPLIEFVTKGAVKNVWRWATEQPVPHRSTTAPFTKDLVLGRGQKDDIQTPETA